MPWLFYIAESERRRFHCSPHIELMVRSHGWTGQFLLFNLLRVPIHSVEVVFPDEMIMRKSID
jgi:hypothetical protein